MNVDQHIAQKIKNLRLQKSLTAKELSEKFNPTLSPKTISSWEIGRTRPNAEMLVELCHIFNVPISTFFPDELSADHQEEMLPSYFNVPLYGSIAAGSPLTIIPVEETHPIPLEVYKRYPKAFLLKVQGESMNKLLPNKSYALIDPEQVEIHEKEIYALCINNSDATIKRVRLLANGVELIPDSNDPTIKPSVLDYESEDFNEITIIGKVVWMMLPFDWEF